VVRYILAAAALKAASTNAWTRQVYRSLGNRFGGPLARREGYMRSHIERGNLFRDLCDRYSILKDGDHLLEIGTGWVHWHSLYHRLFFDVSISMLDVWDCRQFEPMKELFAELKQRMESESTLTPGVRERLERILSAASFEEIYEGFGLQYIVNEQGSLEHMPDNSVDCVFSFHVLEHVQRDNAAELIKNIARVLKPGGQSIRLALMIA